MLNNIKTFFVAGLAILLTSGCSKTGSVAKADKDTASATAKASKHTSDDPETEIDIEALRLEQRKKFKTTGELESPFRLKADGDPIDIAIQQDASGSGIAHAGPAIADVDGDGDQDLLVGDFPGHFWLFENETDDTNPQYVSKGKLQAGGKEAKTPVY